MASAKDLKGTRLGGYTLVEHLATGGMAEIFRAHHEAAGAFRKDLVLKILQPRWAEHQAVVDMFMGEARLAAMLSHPNVVDVYDVSQEDGMYFIAMEYIHGKTLIEVVRRAIEVSQYLPLDVGVHIVGEVAAALAYMNEAPGADGQPMQVVHRDVSPTNVIIGSSGEVKLIDFGIARQGAAIRDEEGVRPGKASYMSPEQARGVPLDGRSDIFSVGTMLYEITVGRRLWRGSRENAIRRIVEEKPVPPSFVVRDYPGDLEMVVMRALEKKPEDRYQSAHELVDDLQRFLQTSGAMMRSHHQMARYLRDLYSPAAEAQITEDGLRQARIFAEGDEGDAEPLDFDQAPAEGPGAALARALRAAGPAVLAGAAASDRVSSSGDQPPVEGIPERAPIEQGAEPAATNNAQPESPESGAAQASISSAAQTPVSPAAQVPGTPAAQASDPSAPAGAGAEAPAVSPSGPTPRQTPVVVRTVRAKKGVERAETIPRSLPIGAILLVAVLLAATAAGLVWLLRGG